MPHEWDEVEFAVIGITPREESLIREAVKKAHKRAQACTEAVKDNWDMVEAITDLLNEERPDEARKLFSELDESTQMDLSLAPSKGGWLTTQQRAALKGL